MSTLHIGLILPDVLGTYGDDGNALVLRQRARMRGLDAEIVPVTLGTAVPEQLDVYTVGGGESFRASGRMVDGLGLLDATTSALKERMIGEIASQPNGGGEGYGADSHVSPSVRRVLDALTEPLTGFANHMGATILGSEARPLGTLTRGTGNTDEHGATTAGLSGAEVERQVKAEGVIQGSVIATYMHGPVLARNPQLADALLAEAMGTTVAELPPMTSEFAEQLTAEVRALRRERLH